MRMHMEGPWLSTTGKRRGKVKWRSAEHKRQAEALAQEWQAVLAKHQPKTKIKAKPVIKSTPTLTPPPGRSDTRHIPSLNGGVDTAPAFKAPDKVYTGTKIIGIGTMHKSNAVPIFTDDDAKAISSMRR